MQRITAVNGAAAAARTNISRENIMELGTEAANSWNTAVLATATSDPKSDRRHLQEQQHL